MIKLFYEFGNIKIVHILELIPKIMSFCIIKVGFTLEDGESF